MNVHQSYQESIHALSMQSYFKKSTIFFNEMLRFDKRELSGFIDSYLKPLVEHDEQKGSDLIGTLRVFLEADGSKVLTAQRLFIVRQSLYYRLNRIKELRGPDFMSPENRIALQVALRAWEMLRAE
ncbi:hypothetical protein B1748_09085 [Paenibacillus sp. MY03]|uniref:PucR family transcriptional regulator n=1 Tax=Paenibacillus sp. MY03 TaxID=302980 RepID=UPI000B3CCA1C|nr:helix-turn-helix domain-containing protein [Paenibacillus sp. MY03]OUS77285.1 hypothetical protein B1748_09085 [Paenibacillus sp. MY03]